MKSMFTAFCFLLAFTVGAQTTAHNVAADANSITAVYPGLEVRMQMNVCDVQMWEELECDSFRYVRYNADIRINPKTGVWHAQIAPGEWVEVHPSEGWTAHRRNRTTFIYTPVREWLMAPARN